MSNNTKTSKTEDVTVETSQTETQTVGEFPPQTKNSNDKLEPGTYLPNIATEGIVKVKPTTHYRQKNKKAVLPDTKHKIMVKTESPGVFKPFGLTPEEFCVEFPSLKHRFIVEKPDGSLEYNYNNLDTYTVTLGSRINNFDLRKDASRFAYAVILESDIVGENKVQTSLNNLYYVEDPVKEAKQTLEKAYGVREAYSILEKMSVSEIFDYAVSLGFDPNTLTKEVAEAKIVNRIEQSPKQFILSMKDKELHQIKVLVGYATQFNVITVDRDGFYLFEELTLGKNLNQVHQYLQDKEHQRVKVHLMQVIEQIKTKKTR